MAVWRGRQLRAGIPIWLVLLASWLASGARGGRGLPADLGVNKALARLRKNRPCLKVDPEYALPLLSCRSRLSARLCVLRNNLRAKFFFLR